MPDGTKVPGVTTICGMLDKPALVGWAGKTMQAWAEVHGQQCWNAGKEGLDCPGMVGWNEILYGARDKAADFGTQVHELFEMKLKGETIRPEPIPREVAQGLSNAMQWLESTALTVKPMETPMVSEEFKFGGTPDAVGLSMGRSYVMDWKTGKSIYPEVALQMAAYRQLLREAGYNPEGAHVVVFSREHADFMHRFINADALDDAWTVFEALLEVRETWLEIQRRFK